MDKTKADASNSLLDVDGDYPLSFLKPHPRFRDGMKHMPWKVISALLIVAVVSITVMSVAYGSTDTIPCLVGDKSKGEPDGDKFGMIVTLNLVIFFVAMVLVGAPVEVTLLFCAAMACLAGAIDSDDVYYGVSESAVVLLALLFPIMKAMGDTGLPDRFISKFMGNPKTMRPALLSMFVSVGLLSGLFNNTPIVVMMIPVLLSYCQRLNFDHKAFLMPLSYAAQAGGNLTLFGTSINLVAQAVFKNHFDIKFFTLTPGAIIIMIVNVVYCCFMAPLVLGKGEKAAEQQIEADMEAGKSMEEVQRELGKRNLFNVAVVLPVGSPLAGNAARDTGMHRITGVHVIHRVLRKGSPEPASLEMPEHPVSTADLRASLQRGGQQSQQPSLGAHDFKVQAEGWGSVQHTVLLELDVIQVAATAEGVANLRQVGGLELGNEASELALLGAKRRERCLAEAVIDEGMVGQKLDVRRWKTQLECAVVGIRNASQPTRCRITYQDYELDHGDVLLLETFKNKIGTDKWLSTFGVVRQVPNSEPPRSGRKNDTVRAVALCVGLLVFLVCGVMHSSFPDSYPWNQLSNVVVATMLLAFILLIRGLTLKEAYSEINGSVLLTIAGALAIGIAMQKTRLANCVADKVLFVVSPFGTMGVKAGLYLATVGIGQFLNSQGNATLMGVIAIPLANTSGIPVGELALTVVYAASACYMSPYGYQTNTLVMKPGGYEWGDYIKFGGLLQLVHMITVVLIVGPCASLIEATGI